MSQFRIAHVSDIHIRSRARHDEYREVFDALVSDMSSQNIDCIIVTGDTFHTKTSGITSEYIDILVWMLRKFATVAPVSITLGNHDMSCANLSRLDAISPIVNAIDDPRVVLHKETGSYKIGSISGTDVKLHVFSLFDVDRWSSIVPSHSDVNIATFHGTVAGASSEEGFKLSSDVSISMFDNFKLTLLGDIHKHQYLAERDNGKGVKKPYIGYPGSTIQQTFGEDIDHGYIVWTLHDDGDWDADFRLLPNPSPFVTLKWNDDVDDLLSAASVKPKGSRFRIVSQHKIPQFESRKIIDGLRKEMSAREVAFKVDAVARNVDSKSEVVIDRVSLRDHNVLIDLCEEVDVHVDDEMADIIKSYSSKIIDVDGPKRCSRWSLKNLKFDNTFGFGEGNEIDVSKLNGLVGILGKNRVGKSSIIGTLAYSLFNTTDRGSIKNLHVINDRANHCYAQTVIDVDGVDHVIERQTVKHSSKRGQHAVTSLNVIELGNGVKPDVDLVGEQRTDTEKVIRKLIGTYDDFALTALSPQGASSGLLNHGSSSRYAYLSRFFDLDVLARFHEQAKQDAAACRSALKPIENIDWNEEGKRHNDCIAEIENELSSCRTLLDERTTEHDLVKSKLMSLEASHNAVVEFEKLQEEKRRLEQTNASLRDKLERCKDQIDRLEKEVVDVPCYDEVQLKSSVKEIERLKKDMNTIKLDLQSNQKDRDAIKRSLDMVADVPCGSSFPTCKFLIDSENSKKKQPDVLARIDQLEKKMNDLAASISEKEKDDPAGKLDVAIESRAASMKRDNEISLNKERMEVLTDAIATNDAQLVSIAEKMLKMKSSVVDDTEYKALRDRERELKSGVDKIREKINSLNYNLGAEKSNLGKYLEKRTEFIELNSKLSMYEKLTRAFSKKGIPSRVLNSLLPKLNNEISNLLSGIIDFNVELVVDPDTDTIEVYVDYGDYRRLVELCSGMEKFVASIVTRVALINMSTLPKPDFLIIDEGFGVLDDTNIETVNRLLFALKKHFRVTFVITHVDEVKDALDNIIEVVRVGQNAFIRA